MTAEIRTRPRTSSAGNPAIQRIYPSQCKCASGPEALRHRLSTVLPLK